PSWTVDLVLDMNQTNTLVDFLDLWEELFIAVDNKILFSLVRSLLEDRIMRKSTVDLLDGFFQGENYPAWKNIFNMDGYIPLSVDVISQCLSSWRDPRIMSEEVVCRQNGKNEMVKKYPADSFNALLERLGERRIKGLVSFYNSLITDFLNIPYDIRESVISRLFMGMKELINVHQGPLRGFFSRLNYFIHKDKDGKYTVNEKQMDLLFDTLKKLLDFAGPEISKVVNGKIGFVKLEEQIAEFVWKGGAVSGCDLILPGLKDVDLKNSKEVFSLLAEYLASHPLCREKISPLASHAMAVLEKQLNAGCEENPLASLCPSPENMRKMSAFLQKVDWRDLTSSKTTDPFVVKKLLLDAMDEIIVQLKKDSLYLYWMHLAKGEVTTLMIRNLRKIIEEQKDFSPGALADLDRRLAGSREFAIIKEDFLENLLQFKINRLSAILEQFNGIMEKSRDADVKLERIFYGLYNQGPLEQLIHSRLYLDNLPNGAGDTLALDTPRAKNVLFQLRKEGMLFKNKYLVKGSRFNLPWMGSTSNSAKFVYESSEEDNISFKGITLARAPFSFKDYFIPGSNAIHVLDDYLKTYAVLQGHNVENAKGELLVDWMQNDLYDALLDFEKWNRYLSEFSFSPVDTAYFKINPYSFSEIRKLSLFYSLNFLYVPGGLPPDDKFVYKIREDARKNPLYLSFLTKENRNRYWSAFQKNYPNFLSMEKSTFFDLLSVLDEKTQEDFHLPWHQMPKYSKNSDWEMLSIEERDSLKVLSTVNLFTVARDGFNDGRYIPLIGTQKECHVKEQRELISHPCPITFLDDGEVS
ncbi:MAG: hypothetical protein OXB84_07995, partial [Halobacteriovoraceae bacterium]|nr:hypothetical protein [Halobacteriovoraceae bacterium]